MKIADWQELEKKLVWVYRGMPKRPTGTYMHPFLSAWLIEEGEVLIREATQSVRVGKGHWVFPPLRSDTRHFSPDAQILSVSFTLCWPTGRMLFESPQTLRVEAKAHPHLTQAARKLLEVVEGCVRGSRTDMKWQDADLGTFLALERLFPDWLSAYCEVMESLKLRPWHFSREDDRVSRAKFYVDHYDMSRPFKVAELAEEMGMSMSHINRLFGEEHGMSVREAYDQRRKQAVLDELQRTDRPCKEIAYAYGFHDPAAFSHWVKKTFGKSPSGLRS
ncbi:helix-turn-helix transcriptional regulator [Kiritimatiellota bacterium B12222]|nr:helix-turn-helix transcriptional regulator [Kiritimatiellota bacterium B12222]